jgi:hypothetical protein
VNCEWDVFIYCLFDYFLVMIEGHGFAPGGGRVAGYGLRVTGYGLRVTGYKL